MRLNKKSLSKVTLSDLLRRKKSSLENFLQETGIVTYELLTARCASIGVVPPTEQEFLNVKGNPATHEISSPMEGIVVMNPPPESDLLPFLRDSLEADEDVDIQQTAEVAPELSSDAPKTKKKKKKEISN